MQASAPIRDSPAKPAQPSLTASVVCARAVGWGGVGVGWVHAGYGWDIDREAVRLWAKRSRRFGRKSSVAIQVQVRAMPPSLRMLCSASRKRGYAKHCSRLGTAAAVVIGPARNSTLECVVRLRPDALDTSCD